MLFLHSTKDPIAPISAVKDFVAIRKSEKAIYVEFEESKHVQLLRHENEKYLKSIEDFIVNLY